MSPLPVSPEPSPCRLTTQQILTEERFDGATVRSIDGPEHRQAECGLISAIWSARRT
jgi:predicted unusual protein kinase regulating ubiquinone biosynthesis (AarF/ABC1/UbiB family)